jgi:threonine aldolase
LKIDHAHAQILSEALSNCTWVSGVLPAETNLILFDTIEPAAIVLAKLEEKGIRALPTDSHRIRFVLHLDVHPQQVEYTVEVLKGIK